VLNDLERELFCQHQHAFGLPLHSRLQIANVAAFPERARSYASAD
jgi:hypothetical protein